MTGQMTIDTSRFDRALAEWRQFAKLDGRKLLEEQARGFIKRVVGVTPPATGTANIDARKAGEGAIKADLAKLFIPVVLKGKRPEKWTDLAAIHDQARNRRGRVNRTNQRYYVDQAKLAALQKLLISRVGILAAGWNASAEKLGVKLPAWVRRHGTAFGSVEVIVSATNIRIVMRNTVKFVNNVEGYERRAQWALNAQAGALERQTKVMLERTARRAGFKVR